MNKDIPFTEDQWWRCATNLNIYARALEDKNWRENSDEMRDRIVIAIDQFRNFAYQLYDNFANQFHHSAKARMTCPNPNCHGIYAYFFADWKYCPKCGTKLSITKEYTEE